QVYLSKSQVDKKLLKNMTTASTAAMTRRKRHQRMDRFVLQYHIRQFGTRKLARRNLHQLCSSVTRLAEGNPRIKLFAILVGVPIMVQPKPYSEVAHEFKPFSCSDFMVPMLIRLCPKGEKLDRWMGNGKVPVVVSSWDFQQALKE
ncbi:unnamed protein product, partial [Discosporangium mesarthrocarpum]